MIFSSHSRVWARSARVFTRIGWISFCAGSAIIACEYFSSLAVGDLDSTYPLLAAIGLLLLGGCFLLLPTTLLLVPQLRPNPLRCRKCGYNLTGLPEPRCPECGEPFDRALLNRGRSKLGGS
jgi:hypothetical protein